MEWGCRGGKDLRMIERGEALLAMAVAGVAGAITGALGTLFLLWMRSR